MTITITERIASPAADLRAKLAAAFPEVEAVLATMREQGVAFSMLSAYLELSDGLDFYDGELAEADGEPVDLRASLWSSIACDVEDAGEYAELVAQEAIDALEAVGFDMGERPL